MGEFSPFERLWNKLLDRTTDNPFILWVVALNLITFVQYWSVGAIYYALDRWNPQWVQKYKTQPTANQPVDRRKLIRVLQRVIYNQLVINTLISLLGYPLLAGKGMTINCRELPTLNRFIFDFIFCLAFREFTFYYLHRLIHHRFFYERFHKRHHEWTAPVAVTAEYADDLEHIMCNMFPVVGGFVLLRSHYITACCYLFHVIFRTLNDHSGYRFPFYYDSRRHDFHHEKFTSCFGVHGWMDWIHGTDKAYRAYYGKKLE